MPFQHFHTEDTNLMIKDPISGKLRHIPTKVFYAFDYESEPVDVSFGSDKENIEYVSRFDRGELVNVCLKVTASTLGENGTDYLGACHVKAQGMEAEMLSMAIEHDMKNQACIELKAKILFQYKVLRETLEDKTI